ncbi:MAG: GFA family protein [bacterium]
MTDVGTDLTAGRCKCGAVHYTLQAPPLFTHACHCLDCQKHTGQAFSLTTFVLRDEMIIHGEMLATKVSPRSTRHHCAKCQTLLFVSSDAFPLSVVLKPDTLDDPAIAPPQTHIWTRRKQAGLVLQEDVPQFEEQYDREMVWPKESLARLREI